MLTSERQYYSIHIVSEWKKERLNANGARLNVTIYVQRFPTSVPADVWNTWNITADIVITVGRRYYSIPLDTRDQNDNLLLMTMISTRSTCVIVIIVPRWRAVGDRTYVCSPGFTYKLHMLYLRAPTIWGGGQQRNCPNEHLTYFIWHV